MNQKGFAPALIILLIALALGGFFVYANYSKNQTKVDISQKTPQPSSFSINKESLVGLWHSLPALGSGWSERYQLYSSGKYAHLASTMKCSERNLGELGTWALKGNKLILTAREKVFLKGGNLVEASGSCGTPERIEGGKKEVQTLENPENLEIDLSNRQREKDEPDWMQSLLFGNKPYWKFYDSEGLKYDDVIPFKELGLSGCGPDQDPCI